MAARWCGLVAVLGVTVAAGALPAGAQEDAPDEVRTAVRALEPFVVEDASGLTGFSVELMRELGDRVGFSPDFEVVDNVGEQLAAVTQSRADAAIGAISITAEREEALDFSQPMFDSGIQVLAGPTGAKPSVGDVLDNVANPAVARILGLLLVGVLLVGVVVWLLERRSNPDFAGGPFRGIWWSTVTAMTVGYGDAVPRRALSRLLTMMWMLVAVLTVAALTAEVTASLTLEGIDRSITSVADLYGKDVVTIGGTTSADFLQSNGVVARTTDDVEQAFEEVASGRADAFVYDAAILRYLVSTRGEDGRARLAGPVLQPEQYGVALPTDSELREPVNRALLELKEDGTYDRLVTAWFG